MTSSVSKASTDEFSEYSSVPNTPPIPRTAVVPAAGLGTRFLPATKTVPKELLPVVDTPGIATLTVENADATLTVEGSLASAPAD